MIIPLLEQIYKQVYNILELGLNKSFVKVVFDGSISDVCTEPEGNWGVWPHGLECQLWEHTGWISQSHNGGEKVANKVLYSCLHFNLHIPLIWLQMEFVFYKAFSNMAIPSISMYNKCLSCIKHSAPHQIDQSPTKKSAPMRLTLSSTKNLSYSRSPMKMPAGSPTSLLAWTFSIMQEFERIQIDESNGIQLNQMDHF